MDDWRDSDGSWYLDGDSADDAKPLVCWDEVTEEQLKQLRSRLVAAAALDAGDDGRSAQ